MRAAWLLRALVGAVLGWVGASVETAVLGAHASGQPAAGMLFGALFLALFGGRVASAGSGLLWGVAAAFFAWLVLAAGSDGPRAAFPELIADLVCFGLPLGLAAGLPATGSPSSSKGTAISVPRALTSGALAGLIGGWAFSKWMEQVDFFPLIAGIVNSDSRTTGIALHYAIAITIGVSFGLLFQSEIRGLGSSLGWGAAYGTLWWFIGPLTLLPLLTHAPLSWTYAQGAAIFGSLVGHIVYGLILGTFYAAFDRVWVRLFYESDPLNREPEGPGLQVLHGLGWGIAGGAVGAVAAQFVVVTSRAMLLHEAPLVSLAGVATGVIVGSLTGAAYGLLFADESRDVAGGTAWGLVYGVLVWFVGTLTLTPLVHGLPFRWTPQAAAAALPALVGDMLFGLITALIYLALERRHRRLLTIDARYVGRLVRRRRPAGTSAPAVWLFFVGCAVTLPIVFSSNP